jgi:hypothetical protein
VEVFTRIFIVYFTPLIEGNMIDKNEREKRTDF